MSNSKKIIGESCAAIAGGVGLLAGYTLGQIFGRAAAWGFGKMSNVLDIAMTGNLDHWNKKHELMMNVFGGGFGSLDAIIGAVATYAIVWGTLPKEYKFNNEPKMTNTKPKL